VHAVTAALVTVTNTASSPVVAQSVNQLTSRNVMLQASADVGTFSIFHQASTGGTISPSTFVVPSGQSLVVTDIDVLPALASSSGPSVSSFPDSVAIANGISHNVRQQLLVPPGETKHYNYSSGRVFTAGESAEMHNDVSNSSFATIYIFGYLTSN